MAELVSLLVRLLGHVTTHTDCNPRLRETTKASDIIMRALAAVKHRTREKSIDSNYIADARSLVAVERHEAISQQTADAQSDSREHESLPVNNDKRT